MEPERLLVAGDTHGNPTHLMYLYEVAASLNASAILQLGDYGYWEHHPNGHAWLDANEYLAEETGIPLAWIDGNHENHPLLWERYKNAPKTPEGFWELRNGVFYIPRGTRWSWNGVRMMGLGGAASIDRQFRLDRFRKQTRSPQMPAYKKVQYESWWPTEEIRDIDMTRALNGAPVDILFCHDKPRGVNVGLKDHPDLTPNQDRIQTVIQRTQPKLVLHGHLHARYTQEMRIGDDGRWCRVEGLAHDGADDPRTSWEVLPLVNK